MIIVRGIHTKESLKETVRETNYKMNCHCYKNEHNSQEALTQKIKLFFV